MPTAATQSARFHWGLKIPMRDGINLNATLYLPGEPSAPAPCIVALTPYICDHLHDRATYFARQGLPFVAVDARGRGNSEGVFRPYIQEAHDGHDVVEWLARQPYCNGKVAMYSGSYLGYAQWATAKESPPHLATIVPTAAPYMGVDFPMRNNIVYPFVVQWLMLTNGRAAQPRTCADRTFWSTIYREWHESGRPFHALGAVLGDRAPLLEEWLAHPELGSHWDAYNPTAEQYARLRIPMLTITASYDDDQPGALEHYKQHMRHASPTARARHYLVIGPWDHAGTAMARPEIGGLKFGPASLLDIPKLHVEWYRWVMSAGEKPGFLQKRVAYYVMGAERWRYADTLEDVTADYRTCYLDSPTNATDIFCSGALGPNPGRGPPDVYTYDPRDTRGPEVDAEAQADPYSLIDQTVSFALRGKQLVYHTAPFEQDTEISGFFKLTAWLAIDCPDTDFYVSVHEIGLDAGSVRLSTDAMRARYREGLHAPKLIDTRNPLQYDFQRFTFVSRQVKRGHRLRLIIAPIGRLIEGKFVQKNYNGGGVVAEESVEDARAVTVRLLHDPDHPSALYVPLGRPETPADPT